MSNGTMSYTQPLLSLAGQQSDSETRSVLRDGDLTGRSQAVPRFQKWRSTAKSILQPCTCLYGAAVRGKRVVPEADDETETLAPERPDCTGGSLILAPWNYPSRGTSAGAGAGATGTGGPAGAACGMEVGVAAAGAGAYPRAAHPAHPALSPTERSPAKSGLHVNFSDKGEVKERREKFLTAKYGSHQMALIRKRLAVEMWLYDELQKLYAAAPAQPAHPAGASAAGAAAASQEVEVDIDELLDMDGDDLRRRHLTTLLADAKKPQKDVHKFINELLEKAKTL